jgi:hypothetical protein
MSLPKFQALIFGDTFPLQYWLHNLAPTYYTLQLVLTTK